MHGGLPYTFEEKQAALKELKRHVYGQGGEQPNAKISE
jgi:hypothetical protein